LDREARAELSLPSRPAHEQHQLTGDGQSRLRPAIGFNQSEAQINSRRNSGRCVNWWLGYKDRVWLDLDLRSQLFEQAG
jgi:hypothetical protein